MTLPAPARDDAAKAIVRVKRLAIPERQRRLADNEAWWKGLAYARQGRASWWDAEVPLRDRAPCVQSRLASTAISRLTSLALGIDKFPRVEPRRTAHGQAVAPATRAAVSELLTQVIEQLALADRAPLAMAAGLGVGSTGFVVSLRDGRLDLQILDGKDCTPVLAPDGTVVSLEVRYRYPVPSPTPREAHRWYRRVIDATHDRVWTDIECDAEGYEPDWSALAPTWECALEFCSVVWHRNTPDPTDPGVDGVALFEGLEGELEALDFALSQRHRNARYNGEPQIVTIGADGDKPLGETGPVAQGDGYGWKTPFSWAGSAYQSAKGWLGGGGSATKKAPGKIWRIPTGGDAKLLESTGAGAAILQGDADDLTRRLLAATGVVMADPQTVAANASAALLREIFRPMLDTCGRLRSEWSVTLVRVLDLALRTLTTRVAREQGVHLDAYQAALPTLMACYRRVVGQAAPRWVGVPLELRWGEYFEPTWQERQIAVATAQAANGGRAVVSHATSIKLLAPLLGVDDAETELQAITGETDDARSATHAMLGALAGGDDPRTRG